MPVENLPIFAAMGSVVAFGAIMLVEDWKDSRREEQARAARYAEHRRRAMYLVEQGCKSRAAYYQN